MNTQELKQVLEIITEGGSNINGDIVSCFDELFLWPDVDSYTQYQVDALVDLGFRVNEKGGLEGFI